MADSLTSNPLVDRLRKRMVHVAGAMSYRNPDKDCHDAADEIERLQREIKHWHASNASMLTYNRQYHAALELIANQQYHGVWDAGAVELQRIAQKALKIPADGPAERQETLREAIERLRAIKCEHGVCPLTCPQCNLDEISKSPFACRYCGKDSRKSRRVDEMTALDQDVCAEHYRQRIEEIQASLPRLPPELPHLDTCKLKYGGDRCTCGLADETTEG